jgi:hypothetical protein
MITRPLRELEERLRAARRVVERAQAALSNVQSGNEWKDYKRALQAQLAAERDLALARGEATCMPVPWEPLWSPSAGSPHVASAGDKTFLVYTVDEHDPAWSESAQAKERLAIVEFKRCYGHRFGGPDNEVWHAHPLYSKGLEPYRPHVVVNSPWIASERQTHSVHPKFKPGRWETLRHYLLLFHEQVFECLAEDHSAEVHHLTYRGALDAVAGRLAR